MKKIELIWRHILYETIEKRNIQFRQQDLAALYGISSSTVNLSLSQLKRLGAVCVGGRGFEVVDAEKILYHWANHRRFSDDIVEQINVRIPVLDIEGFLPEGTIPTGYTAVKERFGEPPADYDKVYCYHTKPEVVSDRFQNERGKGPPNLFVFQADPFLMKYEGKTPLGQLFVDLWNMTDWYAKDFVKIVKERIDGLLS